MPREKRIDTSGSIKTSIYLRKGVHSALKKRAIDLGVRDTAAMEAAIEMFLVTELEQAHICSRCKSVSYAACNHVQITEIGDSVLKTEKSSDLPHNAGTLTGDEITLMESYRIAQRVEHPVWVEMLQSVVRQMELVARAAELEQRRKTEHQPEIPSPTGG